MHPPAVILETTDWSSLYHAYGRATDTPDHLRALLTTDAEARKAALSHLWGAVLHQGTPATVTPIAALVVAGLLEDPRVADIRGALITFLTSVASVARECGMSHEELHRMAAYDFSELKALGDDEALFEDEDAGNAIYAQSVLACMQIASQLIGAMLEGLRDDDPSVRTRAGMGAAELVASAVPHLREMVTAQLVELLKSEDSDERSAHVCSLGMLNAIPERMLSDPSPAVRMCAALGEQFASNPAATKVLFDALMQAEEIDDWFDERPPHFDVRPRFSVVRTLIARVPDFNELLPVAEKIARVTNKYCIDSEWGPLLAAAFPNRDGIVSTDAQRRFLRALADNGELWDPRFGNAQLWFKKIGLPYERQAIAKLAGRSWWGRLFG